MHQRELDELFAELEEEQDGLLDATLDERPVGEPLPAADEGELAGGFRTKLALTPRPYQDDALAAWLAHTVVEAAVRFVAERARMGPGSTSPADFAASAAASRVDMRADRAVCRTPVTHPPFTTVES